MANVSTAMDTMSKDSTTVAPTMTAGTSENWATVKDLVKTAMTAPKAPYHVDREHDRSASVKRASPTGSPSEMDMTKAKKNSKISKMVRNSLAKELPRQTSPVKVRKAKKMALLSPK